MNRERNNWGESHSSVHVKHTVFHPGKFLDGSKLGTWVIPAHWRVEIASHLIWSLLSCLLTGPFWTEVGTG